MAARDDATARVAPRQLIAIFQDAALSWATAAVGTERRVLIDRIEGDDAIGRTEADAPDIDGSCRLPGCAHLAPGTELLATIVAADVMELVAKPSTSPQAVAFFSAPVTTHAEQTDEAEAVRGQAA